MSDVKKISLPTPPPLATPPPDPLADKLKKDCHWFLSGDMPMDLTTTYRELADYIQAHGVNADYYGTGSFLNNFEDEIAKLLGFASGLFVPSGTMAQLIAMRTWCDRLRSNEVAFHPTAHPELNENHAYSHLHRLNAQLIGDPATTIFAHDIEQMKKSPACVLIELPQRRNGGLLPTWEQLEAIKLTALEKKCRLHLDGARLWESQPFYGRSYAEICRRFDSVYVSFYKGINAITGAMLVGSADFIEEARVWLRRHGGNLYHLHPYVISAKMMFDQKRDRFSVYHTKILSLAKELAPIKTIELLPNPPQATMLHLRSNLPPGRFAEFRNLIAAKEKIWLGTPIPFEDGKKSYIEISVGEATMLLPDAKIASVFAQLPQN